jgi:hypothetical protein
MLSWARLVEFELLREGPLLGMAKRALVSIRGQDGSYLASSGVPRGPRHRKKPRRPTRASYCGPVSHSSRLAEGVCLVS